MSNGMDSPPKIKVTKLEESLESLASISGGRDEGMPSGGASSFESGKKDYVRAWGDILESISVTKGGVLSESERGFIKDLMNERQAILDPLGRDEKKRLDKKIGDLRKFGIEGSMMDRGTAQSVLRVIINEEKKFRNSQPQDAAPQPAPKAEVAAPEPQETISPETEAEPEAEIPAEVLPVEGSLPLSALEEPVEPKAFTKAEARNNEKEKLRRLIDGADIELAPGDIAHMETEQGVMNDTFDRMQALRDEVASLNEHANTSHDPEIEAQVLKKEKEIRALERATHTLEATGMPAASEKPEISIQGDQHEHIKALARETRGDAAVNGLEKELGRRNLTTDAAFKEAQPYAEKMYGAEKAYMEALKAHHQDRNIGSVMLEQFVGHRLPKDVQVLRDEWVASRAEYAGHMKQSASERHMAKEGNAHGAQREKVLERYQRIVIAREVVLGAEEAEQKAQMEGLDARTPGWADKAYEKYKKLPPGVRILGTTALLTGAGALATGGAALAFLPAGFAFGAAGLRWAAEANKGTAIGNTASAFALIFSMGAVAGLIGKKGTELFHKAAGTERKAGEQLEQREQLGNLGSAKQLDALSKSRQKALNVTETIERQSRWARLIGAFTGGALFGHATHMGDTAHYAGPPEHPSVKLPDAEPHLPFKTFPEGQVPFTPDSHGAVHLTPEMMAQAKSLHEFAGGDAVSADHGAAAHEIPTGHASTEQAPATHTNETPSRVEHAVATAPQEQVHVTEEDTKLLQEWQKENGGLPPHSDEHITEVIARLREDNGPDALKGMHFEPAAHEAPVPEATPENAPDISPEPASVETPEAAPAETAPATEPAHAEAPANDTPAPPEAEPVTQEAPAPSATPEPAHDAPVETPAAPTAPEAAPAPQEHSEASDMTDTNDSTSTIETSAVNTHGLEIDKVTPHIYADDKGVMVVYGGTTDEQLKMTTKFLKDPENFGKTVQIMTSTPDPRSGLPNVAAVTSDNSPAGFKFMPVITDRYNVPILPPGDNDFVKKIL